MLLLLTPLAVGYSYCTDPVVPFANSAYEQHQRFELSPKASVVAVDWYSGGRTTSGERWAFKLFSSRNELAIRDDAWGWNAEIGDKRADAEDWSCAPALVDAVHPYLRRPIISSDIIDIRWVLA